MKAFSAWNFDSFSVKCQIQESFVTQNFRVFRQVLHVAKLKTKFEALILSLACNNPLTVFRRYPAYDIKETLSVVISEPYLDRQFQAGCSSPTKHALTFLEDFLAILKFIMIPTKIQRNLRANTVVPMKTAKTMASIRNRVECEIRSYNIYMYKRSVIRVLP